VTLDELIEALEELKRYFPAAGTAIVAGASEPVMSGGRVYMFSGASDDDDDDE
jgi:enoyl-CoA hydratase/carnithine racemase